MMMSNIAKGCCKEYMAHAWKSSEMNLYLELDSVTQCLTSVFKNSRQYLFKYCFFPILVFCFLGIRIKHVRSFIKLHVAITLFSVFPPLFSLIFMLWSGYFLWSYFSVHNLLFNQQSHLLISSCQPLHFLVLEFPFEPVHMFYYSGEIHNIFFIFSNLQIEIILVFISENPHIWICVVFFNCLFSHLPFDPVFRHALVKLDHCIGKHCRNST